MRLSRITLSRGFPKSSLSICQSWRSPVQKHFAELSSSMSSENTRLPSEKMIKDLYHCTDENHGQTFQVESRPPKDWKKSGEPDVPRLCVSLSIPQCIAALPRLIRDPLGVYIVDEAGNVELPSSVWDYELTKEHWLSPGSRLTRINTIQPFKTRSIYELRDRIMADIQKTDTLSFRVTTLFAACEVLPEYTSEELADFVNRALSDHGIHSRVSK